MTKGEIRTRILEALNESASSPTFWTSTQIDRVIAEGSDFLASELASIRRTAFVPLRPGATYYYTQGIASNILAPYRLWLTHLDRRLIPVTFHELDRRHETWMTVTGDPEHWFSASWDLFGVWPRPASGGGVLRVDYVAWPQSLVDDDHELEFLEADQDGVVLYGVFEGLLKHWDADRALGVFARFVERLPQAVARNVKPLASLAMHRTSDRNGFTSGVNI